MIELDCAGRMLDLSKPVVMGVLNVTPDSFSDGGRWINLDQALMQAQAMLAQGAVIIDVGGESTRPGAAEVPVAEELQRVLPVIEALRQDTDAILSIDTRKPQVMHAAVEAGATFINDVAALRAPGALEMAGQSGAAVCLMHMQGEPGSMQDAPHYDDVVTEVRSFLLGRVAACTGVGIARERIVIDPGFGFGKTLAHNYALLARLDDMAATGLPVLAGMSRKSMLGGVLNVPPDQRISGGIAAAVLAVERGARIIRTHDVLETVQALQVVAAMRQAAG